ncbi:non-ribosomal peptide synthetase [Streptomyces virginiae]|uniref:non-ribosomal peptide synthetase n=1 Tax=Streptomyces virginiae TaxID=1961 RepID=UPI00068D0650|nr:non-ribosomal peptide synthetase [Streptomyces virginiae]
MIPLSHAQQRLWFHARDGADGALYHIPVGLWLRGALDLPALRAALADVSGRHEALRTVFPDDAGRPHQRVLDPVDAVPVLTVTDCPPAERARKVEEASSRPFDLAAEPPLRADLFTDGAEDHYLLLVLHHIAGDGHSVNILVRDLAAAYTARCAGRPAAWPELPVQYPDYALWQRELLGPAQDPDSLHGRLLTHWAAVLDGLPEELALPADRPRPAMAGHRGALVEARTDAAAHAGLAALAREARATPFMAVQAAFAVLLTRLGAGTDLPIGCPVDGREDEALTDLVGLFVNTLIVRADTSGDPTFTEVLGRVRTAALETYAHQELPFESLVERLNPARSPARHPLFQVAVAAQRTESQPPVFAGLRARVEAVRTDTAKFDLTLEVEELHDPATGQPLGLALGLEYASDLFDEATARRLLDRLVHLVGAVVRDPAVPLSALDVLLPGERADLLEHWQGAPVVPDARTVHGAFEERAAAHPGRPAVLCAGRETTYGELDARADRIAGRLRALGVRPGEAVAVLMDRSADLVAACLGILKAGAAYLPLDARAPRARTEAVLTASGVAVLVTDVPDGGPLPAGPRHVLRPDGRPDVETGTDGTGVPGGHADALAYLMYTSGSTGTPKGVAVAHREVVALATDGRWRGGAHERVLFRSPHAFDASTYELWVPLLNGGLVVVAPPGELDVDALARLMVEEKVTGTFLTATLFNVLADRCLPALGTLHEVMTGGEAASPSMVRRVREACPRTTVTNAYGPTETTTFAATFAVGPGQEAPDGQVPIGRPLDGTQLHVLDERLGLVAPGVIGELYIAGAGLAQGYLGRAALTAERFVACPYGPPGTRMYRSGDLARRTPDGQVEYLGRADRQVKIRGLRIEPAEIEHALAGHPAVGQAAVTVVDTPAGPALAGYAVPAEGTPAPDPRELREHLRATLPDYMVPATLTLLDAFPVTANGKTDLTALPVPGPATAGGATARQEPRTDDERALCAIWEQVLGVPEIGVHDSFFDLGGHSLLATQLLAEVRDRFGGVVGIRQFFTGPTVAELAAALTAAAAADAGAEDPPIVRRARRTQTA